MLFTSVVVAAVLHPVLGQAAAAARQQKSDEDAVFEKSFYGQCSMLCGVLTQVSSVWY